MIVADFVTEIEIGITGTRFGATLAQQDKFITVMQINWKRNPFSKFHHGKCRGVDCETGAIVKKFFPKVKVVLHPPIKTEEEGEAEGDEVRERKSHFARNRDIVDETFGLIVIPQQMSRQDRGGTWYTHDYAVKRGKPVLIIWPDGTTSNSAT